MIRECIMVEENVREHSFSRNSDALKIFANICRAFAWVVMLATMFVMTVLAFRFPEDKWIVAIVAICVALYNLVLYYVIAGILDALKNMQDISAAMVHLQDMQIKRIEHLCGNSNAADKAYPDHTDATYDPFGGFGEE